MNESDLTVHSISADQEASSTKEYQGKDFAKDTRNNTTVTQRHKHNRLTVRIIIWGKWLPRINWSRTMIITVIIFQMVFLCFKHTNKEDHIFSSTAIQFFTKTFRLHFKNYWTVTQIENMTIAYHCFNATVPTSPKWKISLFFRLFVICD